MLRLRRQVQNAGDAREYDSSSRDYILGAIAAEQ